MLPSTNTQTDTSKIESHTTPQAGQDVQAPYGANPDSAELSSAYELDFASSFESADSDFWEAYTDAAPSKPGSQGSGVDGQESAPVDERTEPTMVEKLRGLPWSVATNITNTVFAQFTFFGSVFVLFLNEFGLNKTQIGVLLSPIHFASLIALFIGPMIARHGYKRTFVTFYGVRKFTALLLLATPWIAATYGGAATAWYIAGVVTLFALSRAIEETAYYPWIQEFVPNAIRGKYSAASSMATTATAFLSVAAASFVLGRATGYSGFMLLIGIGVLFGFVSVWTSTRIPGGAPVRSGSLDAPSPRDMLHSLRDRNFVGYLIGTSTFVLATLPLVSFLPLYLREEIGLSESHVVLVQTGALIGGLLSSYLWGWAADRYGSKPITLTSMSIYIVLPIFWWLLPAGAPGSLYLALVISFVQGVADIGWAIGAGRLLFVNVVPTAKKTGYLAVYFACVGFIAGISQLLGGRLLDGADALGGLLSLPELNPYLSLMVLCLVLSAASLLPMGRIRIDNTVTLVEFAGIFLRGNPFRAMSSLFRYNFFTSSEQATVRATEQLGLSASALTVDELLEALADPRFAVRFEAIVSIARTRPHPRLTDALIGVLDGGEVALSVIAAWALGRIGDPAAVPSLRAALDAPYRSIRAHSARALGAIGASGASGASGSTGAVEQAVSDELLARLRAEQDPGLRMAYAAALGQMGVVGSVPDLLALLEETKDPSAQQELALSLARIVGNERRYIQLLRQTQTQNEMGTALSQSVSGIRRDLLQGKRALKTSKAMAGPKREKLAALLQECADSLAADNMDGGIALLTQVARALADLSPHPEHAQILRYCVVQLEQYDAPADVIRLAVHTLSAAVRTV